MMENPCTPADRIACEGGCVWSPYRAADAATDVLVRECVVCGQRAYRFLPPDVPAQQERESQ